MVTEKDYWKSGSLRRMGIKVDERKEQEQIMYENAIMKPISLYANLKTNHLNICLSVMLGLALFQFLALTQFMMYSNSQ